MRRIRRYRRSAGDVGVNSLFQIVAYSLLGYFYLELLPRWLGLGQQALEIGLPYDRNTTETGA